MTNTLPLDQLVSILSHLIQNKTMHNVYKIFAGIKSRLNCLGEEVELSIPFYVLAGGAVFSIFLSFLLPDASRKFLPDTLADALALKDGIS